MVVAEDGPRSSKPGGSKAKSRKNGASPFPGPSRGTSKDKRIKRGSDEEEEKKDKEDGKKKKQKKEKDSGIDENEDKEDGELYQS